MRSATRPVLEENTKNPIGKEKLLESTDSNGMTSKKDHRHQERQSASDYNDTKTSLNRNASIDNIQNDDETDSTKKSAIDEETGEINWDCPCLEGALAPPCGQYFREAFSCFVASKIEPKGSDCMELFTAMQDCFRAHPDIYMRSEDEDP